MTSAITKPANVVNVDISSLPACFNIWPTIAVNKPIAAILTIFLVRFIEPVLPYILSFAAGAMIYVVVEELIPQSQAKKHSNWSTISLSLGFVLMMILDIALS